MKVNKIIISKEPTELEINEITLLTVDEAKELGEAQRYMAPNWWLRSPGYIDSIAAFVDGEYGYVHVYGVNVSVEFGVRPALKISNLESSDFQIGDEFEFAEYKWTIISEDKALCNDVIGYSAFRKEWRAKDANNYEASDVKKWLEDWWKKVKG